MLALYPHQGKKKKMLTHTKERRGYAMRSERKLDARLCVFTCNNLVGRYGEKVTCLPQSPLFLLEITSFGTTILASLGVESERNLAVCARIAAQWAVRGPRGERERERE